MAKKHVTSINKIIAQLEQLQAEVDKLHDEFQNRFDNLSTARQDSEYGEDLRDTIDSLYTASCDGLDTAIDELQNALIYLETYPTAKAKNEVNIDVDISLPLSAGLVYLNRKLSKNKRNDKVEQDTVYQYYDDHWETSFYWEDEDNDGYNDLTDEIW